MNNAREDNGNEKRNKENYKGIVDADYYTQFYNNSQR